MSAQLQQEIERGPAAPHAASGQKAEAPKSKEEAKGKKSGARPPVSLSDEWATFSEGLEELAEFTEPSVEDADQPVLLCNDCGSILNMHGHCSACGTGRTKPKPPEKKKAKSAERSVPEAGHRRRRSGKKKKASKPKPTAEDEFWELVE